MDHPDSHVLFARYQAGEDRAAADIFDRHVRRLIELARQRISPKLSRRIDPEDVVQSAYRSFFIHARAGDIALSRAGDLWRLLAGITLNKLYGQVERHTAGRRDIGRETGIDAECDHGSGGPTAVAPDPTPAEAAAVAEELQSFMTRLSSIERRALEMRLQGATIEEIATTVERSQRTVRRLLEQMQRVLEAGLLTP